MTFRCKTIHKHVKGILQNLNLSIISTPFHFHEFLAFFFPKKVKFHILCNSIIYIILCIYQCETHPADDCACVKIFDPVIDKS